MPRGHMARGRKRPEVLTEDEYGLRVSDRARRAMVKRRAIAAGVPKDGHPHPWRHPVGTEMDRQIVDLSTTMMDTHSLYDEVEHAMKALHLGEGRIEE